MNRSKASIGACSAALALLVGLGAGTLGCSEDAPTTMQRGMGDQGIKKTPSSGSGSAATNGSRRSAPSAEGQPETPPEEEFERPKRPELTRDDFSGRTRDPFHNYMAAQVLDAPEQVEIVRKERAVKLVEYNFDDLRLIAIVNAGRGVTPRALFLSSDQKSKSVKQGEYFSSAEVLLASVNRDYIEVEIVDPELTPGWNLERGERKVIYLKDK
ncbi:MAG: hypothetical protein R6X02_13760 [Enhygromyxa sp.]